MQKKTSLKDIAEKVGVSTALVSYVINGQEKEKRVGKQMTEKIRKAARELNYNPNFIARSLKKGSTHTIGLIVADISNPFFASFARAIEDEAEKFGYNVIFTCSDEDTRRSGSLINTLVNRQVDGMIIAPSENTDNQLLELKKKGIPFVLIDRYSSTIDFSYVIMDNFQSSFHATSFLIQHGHTKIGFIAYDTSLKHMKDRISGYESAMKENGLADEIFVETIPYDDTENRVFQSLDKMNQGIRKRNAIIFATNLLTINGLYYFKRNGIVIPDQTAVIGFDGTPAFDLFNPPITYIEQPIKEMAEKAVGILLRHLEGDLNPEQAMLKHKLVIRNSA